MLSLEAFGWDEFFAQSFAPFVCEGYSAGRVGRGDGFGHHEADPFEGADPLPERPSPVACQEGGHHSLSF